MSFVNVTCAAAGELCANAGSGSASTAPATTERTVFIIRSPHNRCSVPVRRNVGVLLIYIDRILCHSDLGSASVNDALGVRYLKSVKSRPPQRRLTPVTRRNYAALLAVIAGAYLAAQPTPIHAQGGGAENWASPRQADGRPDLQGIWDFRTITPLERPEEFADRRLLTDEDVAALVERALERQVDRPPQPGSVGGYNQFWMDWGTNVVEDRRTSLIVDPPNGRLPPLTPNAFRQEGSLGSDLPSQLPVRYRAGGMGADGPEHRALAERCLVGFNAGPPMAPRGTTATRAAGS